MTRHDLTETPERLAWLAVDSYLQTSSQHSRLVAVALDWGMTLSSLRKTIGTGRPAHGGHLAETRAWQTVTAALVDAGLITEADLSLPVGATPLLAALDVWGRLLLDEVAP